MQWIRFVGFAAGVMLAAGSTVVAQTGPTFPPNPPPIVIGDGMAGSGGSIEPGKPLPKPADGAELPPIPGGDPGAGR